MIVQLIGAFKFWQKMLLKIPDSLHMYRRLWAQDHTYLLVSFLVLLKELVLKTNSSWHCKDLRTILTTGFNVLVGEAEETSSYVAT